MIQCTDERVISEEERGEANSITPMFVVNRHGEREAVYFDKILTRISRLAEGLHYMVDPTKVAQAVINGMFCGITTSELDNLAAQTCAYMAATHPDFSKLAARISVSNLHKNTEPEFAHVIHNLYHFVDQGGRKASLIAEDVFHFIIANSRELNRAIDYERDFEFDYFAFKTLERSYLLRMNGRVVERPQHLFMRVACGIHCPNLEKTIETYDLMSRKYFTHATPTLFNSGMPRGQMSSCFLLQIESDSICGIFDTLKSCALISKSAGGIGVAIHKIRSMGTYINGTNGKSNGIVPMLRVFNDTARYVDQGGGKRKGSFAMYLEPWHADVFEFLEMKRNHGKEETRARDLFYALWVPDLFMDRVMKNESWTLMCPHICPGLPEVYGKEFDDLYLKYESEGRGVKSVKAQALWFAILQSQIETGTPYLLYKDACNRKSNQKNLGTIQCSNLCTEVVEYTAPDEIAVCNLASLSLPKFLVEKPDESTGGIKLEFDHQKLREITKVVTFNLNCVIDRNYYPVPAARKSNTRHRPIGIGIQGFADLLMFLKLPFESSEALTLNREIFETMYYAALEASCELAERDGPYETYKGSPASEGLLQFDLWDQEKKDLLPKRFGQTSEQLEDSKTPLSGRWDWTDLKKRIKEHGLRNSLLVAPMPTASTSQILGNCESFEPYTSNIYSRRVLSGEFFVVNPHLLRDLIKLNLWDDTMKQRLISLNGSIQNIPDIPDHLKTLYKTVWEIKQKALIDLAIARSPFIDQSQSLNLYISNPSFSKLSSMHFYGWKHGLKTGIYYLRTTSAADAIKFTVDKAVINNENSLSAADNNKKHINSPRAPSNHATPLKVLKRESTLKLPVAYPLVTTTSTTSDEAMDVPKRDTSLLERKPFACPLRKQYSSPRSENSPGCLACSG